MEKWEYKVVELKSTANKGWFGFKILEIDEKFLEEKLNALGSEGWELVSMAISLPFGVMCALKRPSFR